MSWHRAILTCGAVVMIAAVVSQMSGDQAVKAHSPTRKPTTQATGEWAAADAVLDVSTLSSQVTGPKVESVLGPLTTDPALGKSISVSVIDVDSGQSVYEEQAGEARTPASTIKILTAVAVLDTFGPEHQFTTTVVADSLEESPVSITLVGGGDPTLTTVTTPGRASLEQLADDTAEALREAGIDSVSLSFDASLFIGDAIDPDWKPTYVPDELVSPVSALGVDLSDTRPDDPAAAAASTFQKLLVERDISVDGSLREQQVAEGASELAKVTSAPLGTIVEDMLATSDNDVAEVLARHVAPDGDSQAVVDRVAGLGVNTSGVRLLDGSGLARGNTATADAIANVLALAAGSERTDLRPIITGLPVAGFNGTLEDRFSDEKEAVGQVRGKTGTLSRVSGLAGVTTSTEGGRYVFAVLADDVPAIDAAREALDSVAAALSECGCSVEP